MDQEKVQVWIYTRKGEGKMDYRFLLLKTTPKRGGFWQPVTGGVEPEEELEAAAAREAREETGLQFSGDPEPIDHRFSFERDGICFNEYGFAMEAVPPGSALQEPAPRLDPKEHVQFEWVTAKEALERVKFSSNAEMLKKFFRKQLGR